MWKRHVVWCLEASALLAAALALRNLLGIHPPGFDLLWVPVLLVASRYGYAAGLLTGIAAGLAALGNLLAVPSWWTALATDPAPLVPSLAFGAAGALLGELRSSQERRHARTVADLTEARADLVALEAHHDILRQVKRELDRRIVGETRTLEALFEMARALDSLEERKLYHAALSLLERFFDVGAAAAYEATGSGLLVCRGQIGTHPGRRLEVTPAGQWEAALRTGKVQTPRTRDQLAESHALLLVPVRSPGGGPRGLLAIEDLPMSQLTAGNLRLLEVVADWTGRALARAADHRGCSCLPEAPVQDGEMRLSVSPAA